MKKLFRKSSNNFFFQAANILSARRKELDVFLQMWGYELSERAIYLKAYDYFVLFPDFFDGATKTEELNDIPGLDLDAMLHDYVYVALNLSVDWNRKIQSDKLLRIEMMRRGKSSWNAGYRYYGLLLSSPIWIPFCWLIKGRRITESQKQTWDIMYKVLQ